MIVQWQRENYVARHKKVWLSQFPLASSGPFKGILTGYWWVESQNLQFEFKFKEVEKLTRRICYLQPYNPKVWEYLSWNLSFNLMAESLHDRKLQTYWLLEGINQLIKGLEYNPNEHLLEYALGVTVFLKTQGDYDFTQELNTHLGVHPFQYSKGQMIKSKVIENGEYIMGLQAINIFLVSGNAPLAIDSCNQLIKRFPQHRESLLGHIKFINSAVEESGK